MNDPDAGVQHIGFNAFGKRRTNGSATHINRM